MSEQNILNPNVADPLNPQFGLTEAHPEMFSRFRPRVGPQYSRRFTARGRVWSLQWLKRSRATRDKLQQWAHQYEQGYFTIADYERSRYYTGSFAGPLTFSPVGYEQWNIQGDFEEGIGLPMYDYPANWNRDAIFIEERDDWGTDCVKLTGGGWILHSPNEMYHGMGAYDSNVLDAAAEWEYFGYGFRLWSFRGTDRGILELSLDGVVLGPVDCFSAVNVTSSPMWAQNDVVLGIHRVKIRCTGNKNAASTNTYISADAIEVMR